MRFDLNVEPRPPCAQIHCRGRPGLHGDSSAVRYAPSGVRSVEVFILRHDLFDAFIHAVRADDDLLDHVADQRNLFHALGFHAGPQIPEVDGLPLSGFSKRPPDRVASSIASARNITVSFFMDQTSS